MYWTAWREARREKKEVECVGATCLGHTRFLPLLVRGRRAGRCEKEQRKRARSKPSLGPVLGIFLFNEYCVVQTCSGLRRGFCMCGQPRPFLHRLAPGLSRVCP